MNEYEVGDTVLLRKVRWNGWVNSMDRVVGEPVTIKIKPQPGSETFRIEESGFWFPVECIMGYADGRKDASPDVDEAEFLNVLGVRK